MPSSYNFQVSKSVLLFTFFQPFKNENIILSSTATDYICPTGPCLPHLDGELCADPHDT